MKIHFDKSFNFLPIIARAYSFWSVTVPNSSFILSNVIPVDIGARASAPAGNVFAFLLDLKGHSDQFQMG